MGKTRVGGMIIVLVVLTASLMTSVLAAAPAVQQLPDDADVSDDFEQAALPDAAGVESQGRDSGRPVELRVEDVPASGNAPDSETRLQDTSASVQLVLDDGQVDRNVGVVQSPTNTSVQFLWLNRFTPGTAQLPLRLNQIHVFFDETTDATQPGAKPGDRIDLVVYHDVDANPANGATLLATFKEAVQVADGVNWSVYDLDPPVDVLGTGDVLIGAIPRFIESGVTQKTYPAALDNDTTQRRSWIAWWDGADPPDPAVLPSDDTFALVDNLGSPGNWMIRGFGETISPPPVHVYLPVVAATVVLPDEYEPNDHWSAAYGPLDSGHTYQALPDDTDDYYYFELATRAAVSVQVNDFAPTSSNGTVMLYGPAVGDQLGKLIQYYGIPGHSSMSLGPHELDPGKYYIRVYTVEGHYSWNQLYSLTVTSTVGCPPGTLTPDDPRYYQQWGMDKINAPRAWYCGFQGSSDVVVAVIDSGVDMDHPEFTGKLVAGKDWANDDNWPDDDHGHGTHVAGIVGAIGNNGAGVAGVAWNTRIMPLKTLDADGSGWVSWSIQAVLWAADNGADVINMSLGSTYRSDAFQQAVNYAHGKGVLVVASAGNCGDGAYTTNGCDYQDQPSYPGAYDNVVAVASTAADNTRSSFSTRGSYVDVAAPGSEIYSTFLVDAFGGYREMSGTSQASPHVAGLAALIKAAQPALTPAQITSAVQNSAVDLGLPGKDDQFGWGLINAAAALGADSSAGASTDTVRNSPGITPKPLTQESGAEIAPGVVLARFRSQVSVEDASGVLANLDQTIQVASSVPQIELLILSVPVGSEWDVIESLRALPQVEYAEPDLLVHIH